MFRNSPFAVGRRYLAACTGAAPPSTRRHVCGQTLPATPAHWAGGKVLLNQTGSLQRQRLQRGARSCRALALPPPLVPSRFPKQEEPSSFDIVRRVNDKERGLANEQAKEQKPVRARKNPEIRRTK
jgi:hypothetical protein